MAVAELIVSRGALLGAACAIPSLSAVSLVRHPGLDPASTLFFDHGRRRRQVDPGSSPGDDAAKMRDVSGRRPARWDRALARYRYAEAALAAVAHTEDDDLYDRVVAASTRRSPGCCAPPPPRFRRSSQACPERSRRARPPRRPPSLGARLRRNLLCRAEARRMPPRPSSRAAVGVFNAPALCYPLARGGLAQMTDQADRLGQLFTGGLSPGLKILFYVVWTLLFAFAVFTSQFGIFGGSPIEEIILWSVPSALFLITSAVCLRTAPRRRSVAILSLSLLLIASSNFVALPYWQPDAYITGFVSGVGWTGLLGSIAVFPTGDFKPKWIRWLVLAAALFFLTDPLRTSLAGDNDYLHGLAEVVVFVLLLVMLLALWKRMIRLPNGVERQRLEWLFVGGFIGAGLIGLAAAGAAASDLLGLTDNAIATLNSYRPALIAAGYSVLAVGIIVAFSVDNPRLARLLIRYSATYGLLVLISACVWAGVDLILKKMLERIVGDSAYGVSIAFAVLSTAFLKPVKDRVEKVIKLHFASKPAPPVEPTAGDGAHI